MKLHITRGAWDKIMAYTMLCPDEISGLGKVNISGAPGEEVMIVSDVAIFRQSVSGAHSTIPTAALAEFQTERVQAGESMREWCFWWHSHATMDVFFSQTDTNTIEGSTEFPYLVSLVVNKKRQHKARLDVHSPVHMFLELEVEVLEETNEEVKTLCQAEIDAKVTKPQVKYWDKRENLGYNTAYDPERNSQLIQFSEDGWDEKETWVAHKNYLIDEIKKAKSRGQKYLLVQLKEELQEHFTFGKSHGFTISRE